MEAEKFTEMLKEKLEGITEKFEVSFTEHGLKKTKAFRAQADAKPEKVKEAVKKLFELHPYPHFSVSSGYDSGETIVLLLHFSLNTGIQDSLVLFTLRTTLSKKNPSIETISDLIPGAAISELEKKEFLGIKVKGLEERNIFLDKEFKGIYPWRTDEKGAGKKAKNIHAGEKNG